MSRISCLVALCALEALGQTRSFELGRPARPEEIDELDITVFPDGRGLPPGRGNAVEGKGIYEVRCVRCHNTGGTGRQGEYPALIGGKGSLGTAKPKKTVGSYWPYATTLWDHIHRAMPFDQPRTLSPDRVYALTAYVLFLNGIVTETFEVSRETLPAVAMPNRNGFYSVYPGRKPNQKLTRNPN